MSVNGAKQWTDTVYFNGEIIKNTKKKGTGEGKKRGRDRGREREKEREERRCVTVGTVKNNFVREILD